MKGADWWISNNVEWQLNMKIVMKLIQLNTEYQTDKSITCITHYNAQISILAQNDNSCPHKKVCILRQDDNSSFTRRTSLKSLGNFISSQSIAKIWIWRWEDNIGSSYSFDGMTVPMPCLEFELCNRLVNTMLSFSCTQKFGYCTSKKNPLDGGWGVTSVAAGA